MYNCGNNIVVSTLRCGRNNPGSNPGHGIWLKSSEDTFKHNSRGVSQLFSARTYVYEKNNMYLNIIFILLHIFHPNEKHFPINLPFLPPITIQ